MTQEQMIEIRSKIAAAIKTMSWNITHEEMLLLREYAAEFGYSINGGCGSCFWQDLKRFNDFLNEG